MSNPIYLRGDAQRARHHINDYFESHGQGRPVGPADIDGHLSAVTVDGKLCGAAYAAAAMTVGDSMLLGGRGIESIFTARRFQAVEAMVVSPDHRRLGYGTNLLCSIAAHAGLDHSAEYLLARVGSTAPALQSWFTNRGFNVVDPGEFLTVDGIPLAPADGYRDAWLRVARTTRSVTSVSTTSFH